MADGYATLLSEPPHPLRKAIKTWVESLVAMRDAEVSLSVGLPSVHFSAAGSDTPDPDDGGSADHPYLTLAKAQAVLDAATEPTRLLFNRGDEWAEDACLASTKCNIAIGAYGTGDKPLLSDFTRTITSGWSLIANNWYLITGEADFGWIRDRAERLNPYCLQVDAAAVEANAFTFFWEATAGGTIHINCGGVNPNTLTFELNLATMAHGLDLSGDNVRIEGVRVDGFSCSKADPNVDKYNITLGCTTSESSVVKDCESYYSGNHAIFYYKAGAGGICTIRDCTAGLGYGSAFGSFASTGGQEIIIDNCTLTSGQLPRHDGVTSGLSANFVNIHRAASGNVALAIVNGCTVTDDLAANDRATWAHTDCQVSSGAVGSEADWSTVRGFLIDYLADTPSPSNTIMPLVTGFLVVNSRFNISIDGTAPTALAMRDPFGCINTVFQLRDAGDTTHRFLYRASDAIYLNCHFDFVQTPSSGAVLSFGDNSVPASVILQNCIVSGKGYGGAYAVSLYFMDVTATDIINNAYYGIKSADAGSYALDTGKVVLSAEPVALAAVASTSQLYQVGKTTVAFGAELEYSHTWGDRCGFDIGPVASGFNHDLPLPHMSGKIGLPGVLMIK